MTAIWAFTHDHVHGSEDELALQLLGIRLFNTAGVVNKSSRWRATIRGHLPVRDVIETSFLVDYLSTNPAEIDEWRRADRRKRMKQFSADRIRNHAR